MRKRKERKGGTSFNKSRRLEEEEEEEEEEELTKSKLSCVPHPYNVFPLGNKYLDGNYEEDERRRMEGLGNFTLLQDEFLVEILFKLSFVDVVSVMKTSRYLYLFATLEDVWRKLVFKEFGHLFKQNNFIPNPLFLHSYRITFARCFLHSKTNLKQTSLQEGEEKEGKKERKEDLFLCDAPPLPSFQQNKHYSDSIYNRWFCSNASLSPFFLNTQDNLQRIQYYPTGAETRELREEKVEEKVREKMRERKPFVLRGGTQGWPANEKWKFEQLVSSFPSFPFKTDKAGEEEKDEENLEITLPNYLSFASQIKDKNPLYIFDDMKSEGVKRMKEDYKVLPFFNDLFSSLLPPTQRPPDYQWIIIGCEASGSPFHKDPLSTSAWNALIIGKKKWIFFPPHLIPPGCFPGKDEWDISTPDSAVEYFIDRSIFSFFLLLFILTFFVTRYQDVEKMRKRGEEVYECIQSEGEIGLLQIF